MKPSILEPQSSPQSHNYRFRKASAGDASGIVACYESVFGPGGIRASGHDPYPAPEVFSEQGVNHILNDAMREFFVMEVDRQIAAGMIVTHNSRFHREFGCVAVARKFQGNGISTAMLTEAKEREQGQLLSINVTEIVTHSMLSQSAHKQAGFGNITGFGFCQYPNVFFARHPESCLWITAVEGVVADRLRRSRPCRKQPGGKKVGIALSAAENDGIGQDLFDALSKARSIYVLPAYFDVVSKIAAQFDDILSYRIFCGAVKFGADEAEIERNSCGDKPNGEVEWKPCGDEPYAYIDVPPQPLDPVRLAARLESIISSGKRFIQARISTHAPAAVGNIELLKQSGFIFLGWVPLFRVVSDTCDFEDVLLMQWVSPAVLAKNALPGETDSVVKLHGFPLNLTGDIVATMRRDMRVVEP